MSGNKVFPTSTVSQSRIRLFQETQRPTQRVGEWQINYSGDGERVLGRCRVTGRLGQRHADLVESILFNAEAKRDVSDGGIELLVDPAKIRKTMSDSRYSKSQILKLLAELRAATVEIETPKLMETGDRIIGGLIDHVKPSTKTRRDPLTGGERPLWVVRVGVALIELMSRDLCIYGDPAPVARMNFGITQAATRYLLTHDPKRQPVGGWFVDTIIFAVSGQIEGDELRKARSRIRSESEKLHALGIIFANNKIMRVAAARDHATAAR